MRTDLPEISIDRRGEVEEAIREHKGFIRIGKRCYKACNEFYSAPIFEFLAEVYVC